MTAQISFPARLELTCIRFVLTKFGEPEPWSPEEAQVFLAKVKNELNDPRLHFYVWKRRVWGMKPLS